MPFRNIFYRIQIPVPSDKNIPVFFLKFPQKILYHTYQFLFRQLFLYRIRNLQFIHFTADIHAVLIRPFCRMFLPNGIDSKSPRNFPDKNGSCRWPVRRYTIPCRKPGIIEAFFRIFMVMQKIPGNFITVAVIFSA